LTADALANVVASLVVSIDDPETRTHWLSEFVVLCERVVRANGLSDFALDPVHLRAFHAKMLDEGRSLAGLDVPDVLPDDIT